MNKNLRMGFGVLLALMGMIFTLQGLGFLAGSRMTGETQWAVIGPIVALVGVVLFTSGVRARRL